MRRTPALLGLALVLTACSANQSDKLGAPGEFCQSDLDCRDDLICDNFLCTPDRDDNNGFVNNDSNNDFPNNDNNFPNNNDACGDGACRGGESPVNCPIDCGPTTTCEDACARIDECLGEGFEDCVRGCRQDTGDLPDDVREDLLSCLTEASCDEFFNGEIERCIEGTGIDDNNDPGPPPDPGPDPEPLPEGPFRFVLIDDGETEPGENPGADIDAIGLLNGRREIFADSIMEASVGPRNNRFADPSQLLGPPDSDCEIQNITSLGGGYVIVAFGGSEIAFERGAVINVYELGETQCGRFDDDSYTVAVSDDLGTFIVIGDGFGSGQFVVDF